MCLILMASGCRPDAPLVVVANRDEFYSRPTAPLAFWEDAPVLGGRDLECGGTWMGIAKPFRFAAVTNYRDPATMKPHAPSRGHLVSDYLCGQQSARAFLEDLTPKMCAYHGFNLILGDAEGLFYCSNQAGTWKQLPPGLYGLSNHLLDTPWPKVERARSIFHAFLQRPAVPSHNDLLAILTDRTMAEDADLPKTGVSLEWERCLSPIFVRTPDYGTRSSTTLRVRSDGSVKMAETTWPTAERRTFSF